jgi:hypothetical protein
MNKTGWLVAVILLAGLLTGCGGARDKGKNQDFDRPRGGPTAK